MRTTYTPVAARHPLLHLCGEEILVEGGAASHSDVADTNCNQGESSNNNVSGDIYRILTEG